MTSPTAAPVFGPRLIGEIAASLPGATAVFRQHKLDFCCGGDVPLHEAAAARGVDVATVETALAELARQGTVPSATDTPTLIAHIMRRYHETHRRELPELIRLAARVEAVHRSHPRAPLGLAAALEDIERELAMHMQKEEQILFPLMLDGGHPMIVQPIGQMRHDHADHGEAIGYIERITGGFTLPDDACRSWQALYAGTEKLVADLRDHIHLENNVLFPRFDSPDAA